MLVGEATWGDFKRFLATAAQPGGSMNEFVRLRVAPFNGEFYVLAFRSDGTRVRFDAAGTPAMIDHADVGAAIRKLEVPVKSLELMYEEDSFYYGHKDQADLPGYRAVLDDAEETRLHIDPVTGTFRAVDASGRRARWMRRGLHGFDFAGIRERPVWDVLVLLLLAGVTAVCVTGTWMALKRIRLDCRGLRARFGRHA